MFYSYKEDKIYFDNEKQVMKNKLGIEDQKLLIEVEHKNCNEAYVELKEKESTFCKFFEKAFLNS